MSDRNPRAIILERISRIIVRDFVEREDEGAVEESLSKGFPENDEVGDGPEAWNCIARYRILRSRR